MKINRIPALAAAAASLAVVAATVLTLSPASAAVTAPLVPQRLTDQLANCQDMQRQAQTTEERAWARNCVNLATRAIRAATPPTTTAAPTPTATATRTPTPAPTTVPPTTTPPPTSPGPRLNCWASPHLCGFPDATNSGATGPFASPEGDLSVTVPGTLISGRDIGCLSVTGANVIIRNVRIHSTLCAWVVTANAPNLVLDHVTISCGGTPNKGIVMQQPATIMGSEISGCEDGVYIDPAGGTVLSTYVHGMFDDSGGTLQHTDSVQLVEGAHDVLVQGNTLADDDPQGNSAISIDTPGSVRIALRGNLLAGGGWAIRCPRDGTSPSFVVDDNRINVNQTYTQHGAWLGCGTGESEVLRNVDDVTGAPLDLQ